MPRDRAGTFEPQTVRKRQWRLTGVDETVLSLYAKGLTIGEISAHFAEIYGASVCIGLIAGILGSLAGFATGSLLVLDVGNAGLVVCLGYLAARPRCSTTRSRTGATKASSAARTEPGRTARPPRRRERTALPSEPEGCCAPGAACRGGPGRHHGAASPGHGRPAARRARRWPAQPADGDDSPCRKGASGAAATPNPIGATVPGTEPCTSVTVGHGPLASLRS